MAEPTRPNVSLYESQELKAKVEGRKGSEGEEASGAGGGGTFANLAIFTGEDERFAFVSLTVHLFSTSLQSLELTCNSTRPPPETSSLPPHRNVQPLLSSTTMDPSSPLRSILGITFTHHPTSLFLLLFFVQDLDFGSTSLGLRR